MNQIGDINHKRGCRVRWSCATDVDITGWEITSKIRARDGDLIAALVVVITGAMSYRLEFSGDTSSWPIGLAFLDILYTLPSGDKRPTNTLSIAISELQTHAV